MAVAISILPVAVLLLCRYVFAAEFVEEPQDVLIAVGGPAVFHCAIAATTAVSLQWFHNGQLLPTSQFFLNGTLVLPTTQASDEGTYRCVYTELSTGQELESSATLTFAYITPTIARGPEDQSVSEGDDVHFLCLHDGSLPVANIYWTHNSLEIAPGDSPRVSVSSSPLSQTQVSSTLSINGVELEDAGQYICTASNPVLPGSMVESQPAILTVLAVPRAPSITADPVSVILPFIGRAATFACSFAGSPPPSIEWLHNGTTVTAGTRVSISTVGEESQLSVMDVAATDTGSYQCVAVNSLGQASSQLASLTIASIDADFQFPPPPAIEAILSLDATIPCSPPPSTPPADVSWTKSFSQLNPPRFTVAPNNSLVIRSVQLGDAGEYYCTATNPISMVSRTGGPAVVTVLTPPSITQPPQNTSAAVGSAAIFTCVASGNPAPAIMWIDPSNQIIQNSANFSVSGSELRLSPVGRGDGGRYTCQASSQAGTVMSAAFLDVQYAPEVGLDNVTVTSVTGDSAALLCGVTGNPAPSYTWHKDAQEVTGGGVFSIASNGTLFIAATSKSMEGQFVCTGRNPLGAAMNSVTLRVLVPASIEAVESPVTVVTGFPTSLNCPAQGDPSPTVRWTFDSQPFPPPGSTLRITVANGNQTISLSEAVKSDEGVYTCTASNSLLTVSMTISLVVYIPPTIVTSPESLQPVEGSEILLDCVANGDPPPTISWELDSVPLNRSANSSITFHPNGSLSLTLASQSLEGVYTCTASNPGGVATLSHDVDVKVPARVSLPGTVALVAEREGRVHCAVEADPPPIIDWFLPDRTMVSTSPISRIRSLGNGTLLFTNTRVQDGGEYICEAVNSLARSSASVLVEIYVAPSVVVGVGQVRGVARQDTILNCTAEGTPPPVVTWYRGLLPLATRSDGSLLLSPLSLADGGVYTCVAENAVGVAEANVTLTVLETPTADTPTSVTVTAGVSSTVTCSTTGIPPPTVNWYRPDGSIITNTSLVAIATNGDLILTLQSEDDGGQYTCEAVNEVATATSSVMVTVHVPPSLTATMETVISLLGQSAELECVAMGNPPPIISWSRGPQTLPGSDQRLSQLSGLLRVTMVTLDDEGVYTCTAVNSVGEASSNVQLIVYVLPTASVMPSTLIVHFNQSASFNCSATGKPQPQLSWLHNGVLIEGSSPTVILTPTSLLITMATAEDAGVYTCSADNGIGRVIAMATLTVLFPPDPPTAIALVTRSESSISVTWSAGNDGGSPITSYLVEYQLSGESPTLIPVPMATTSIVLTGLVPYGEYSVRVSANNVVGQSQPSSTATARTLATAPSRPRNVRVTDTSLFSITVAWDVPIPLNGPFFAYRVRYRQESSEQETFDALVATQYRIDGVVRGSVYLFRVGAGTLDAAGTVLWGEFAEIRINNGSVTVSSTSQSQAPPTSSQAGTSLAPITSSVIPSSSETPSPSSTSSLSPSPSSTSSPSPTPTDPPVLTPVPRSVTTTVFATTTVVVLWQPPVGSLTGIDGYRVTISPPHPDGRALLDLPLTQTTLVLSNLNFFTEYTFQVAVYNELGNGPFTDPVSATTGEGAPTAPVSVQVAIVAVDEAVVSWDPPHPPNGVVTQYDVRLTDTLSGTPLTVAVPADQGTQSSFDVVQGAEYTVQVRARNGPLVGEYSGPVTFTATFVAMDTSTPHPSPSSVASTSSSSEGVSATPTSSAAVEPSSSEGVSAPPTSSAAPTETAPPTTTGVAPPTPSPPSPSPTIPLTGSTGGLSQQDIIVIAVCCALIALLLLLLVLCAVYVACRKCRDSPDKSLKYKLHGHQTELTELHDENALPQKDLETLHYRSQGEGQGNFTLSHPRERDTPEEGSDFSEFEHLDYEDDNRTSYYTDNQQEFVVVDDMTKLVVPDEEDLAAYRHNAPHDWFDDPAYARIAALQQDTGRQTGRGRVANVGKLPSAGTPLQFDPGDATYAEVNSIRARKAQQREEKMKGRGSRETLDSVTGSKQSLGSQQSREQQF